MKNLILKNNLIKDFNTDEKFKNEKFILVEKIQNKISFLPDKYFLLSENFAFCISTNINKFSHKYDENYDYDYDGLIGRLDMKLVSHCLNNFKIENNKLYADIIILNTAQGIELKKYIIENNLKRLNLFIKYVIVNNKYYFSHIEKPYVVILNTTDYIIN